MTIGERIKALRIAADLSQYEVAKAINATKQAVYKYENNIVTNIPIDKISAMAQLFNVSPSRLMGWSDDELKELAAYKGSELTEKEMLILNLFHTVPEDRQEELLALIEAALKMQGLL